MKKLILLGASGNIGEQALSILKKENTYIPSKQVIFESNAPQVHSVTINKNDLIATLRRISLFASDDINSVNSSSRFSFSKNGLVVSNMTRDNVEEVKFSSECNSLGDDVYSANFYLKDVIILLSNCEDEYVDLLFGGKREDGTPRRTLVISRGNVKYVVPEKDVGA